MTFLKTQRNSRNKGDDIGKLDKNANAYQSRSS